MTVAVEADERGDVVVLPAPSTAERFLLRDAEREQLALLLIEMQGKGILEFVIGLAQCAKHRVLMSGSEVVDDDAQPFQLMTQRDVMRGDNVSDQFGDGRQAPIPLPPEPRRPRGAGEDHQHPIGRCAPLAEGEPMAKAEGGADEVQLRIRSHQR